MTDLSMMVAPFSIISRRDIEGIVNGRVREIIRSVYDIPSRGHRIPGIGEIMLVMMSKTVFNICYFLLVYFFVLGSWTSERPL